MCAQHGITERLEHCKQKQKEKNNSTRGQAKKQGVKHARAPLSQQKTPARDRVPSTGDSKGSDDDADSVVDAVDVVDVDAGSVGFGIPESMLDERVSGGVKQYLITWLNLPESCNSWELASEYDDGAYGGAYVELVQEWEEYKLTDQQYTGPTTTPAAPITQPQTQKETRQTHHKQTKRNEQTQDNPHAQASAHRGVEQPNTTHNVTQQDSNIENNIRSNDRQDRTTSESSLHAMPAAAQVHCACVNMSWLPC